MLARVARASLKASPLVSSRRFTLHQDNGPDDNSWLEAKREQTAEERWAYRRSMELLQKHAAELNAKYEAEHAKTREQMESHQNRNAASVAALEAKIAELTSMIQQMKAEGK